MTTSAMPTEQPQVTRSGRLWRNRSYMLLWSGQAISTIGTEISTVAFPLLALLVTNSPVQAGLMGATRALPYLFFSLPAGALVDRWDRKRVMILCDTGRVIAMGSIPIALALNHLSVAQLYIVSALEGSLFVFFNIAEVACLPRVVSKEQLPAATAQNAATDGTAALVGPALGGALFGLHALLPFVADAISYTVSVVTLFFIPARFQGERKAENRRSLRKEIAEGLAWLWHQPLIRFIAVLTGVTNIPGLVLIIIVVAQEQMHASSLVVGLIFTIGGIGGIIGAAIAPWVQKRARFATVIISMMWLWTLLFPLYALAPNPVWLGIVVATAFVSSPVYNVVQMSYRLALIPDELQGRVNSVFRLIAFAGQPIGLAITGLLLEAFNPLVTVLAFMALQAFVSILATVNSHVRNAKPLAEVEATA
ncbi:MAG TPA: MFS transporter [Ktedonobacterales bacterium]|nr:MFS transporter [Ktedonobacterales bacterium]